MPNFKLSSNMRGDIRAAARALTVTYEHCATHGFPLTPDELQYALLDPDLVAKCREVERTVGGTMNTYSEVNTRLTRAELPGLTRHVALCITNHKSPMFLKEHTGLWGGSTEYDNNCDRLTPLDTSLLSDETKTKLVKWCHEVIRARRLAQLANATVGKAMEYLTSTGHVLANWPILGTLDRDNVMLKRFRAAPVKLDRYKMDLDYWPELRAPRIKAAEVVLNAALMLGGDTTQTTKPEVTADVVRWEKLSTDVSF